MKSVWRVVGLIPCRGVRAELGLPQSLREVGDLEGDDSATTQVLDRMIQSRATAPTIWHPPLSEVWNRIPDTYLIWVRG